MEYRTEHDSMGEIKVPADRLWAAQTQRSHENFEIGVGIETMPMEIIHAFGVLKKAAAVAKLLEGKLDTSCPATMLNLHPDVVVVCDTAAMEG